MSADTHDPATPRYVPRVVHGWRPSKVPGYYVSSDGGFTAELRRAGRYPDLGDADQGGVRMFRHYAIRYVSHPQIIGTATTLRDAAARYL